MDPFERFIQVAFDGADVVKVVFNGEGEVLFDSVIGEWVGMDASDIDGGGDIEFAMFGPFDTKLGSKVQIATHVADRITVDEIGTADRCDAIFDVRHV
jgi:hypothetical protein